MPRRSGKSREPADRAARGRASASYEYEVFVSYRRRDPVLAWVNNHFFPKLLHWLPQFWPSELAAPRVAKDDQMETGVRWPQRLVQMHAASRCMIAVVSPEYFRSAWCVAEWRAMVAREAHCGLAPRGRRAGRASARLRGLIYPVLFCGDASTLPGDAAERQWIDFTRLNSPDDVFRFHPAYVSFDQAMQNVARELAGMIRGAPPRATWPRIALPASLARPTVTLPRL